MSSITIREATIKDVNKLANLHTVSGWKISREHITKIVKFSNSNNYSKLLVADSNEEIVGRVILDTVFPPYAEIVNIIVHPNYRGMGIGTYIITECIKRAVKVGHNIIYLMCDPVDRDLHRFYSRLGFLPGILGNPASPRGDMWLYRFDKGSFVNDFLEKHPFAEFQVSRSKEEFHGIELYSMEWRDPITEDELKVFIKGQPGQPKEGGTMPRINAVSIKSEELSLDCWVVEENSNIYRQDSKNFRVHLLNNSDEALCAKLIPLPSRGIRVSLRSSSNVIIPPKSDVSLIGELTLSIDFDVKVDYLTFPTIVSSLIIGASCNTNLLVSTGFNLH